MDRFRHTKSGLLKEAVSVKCENKITNVFLLRKYKFNGKMCFRKQNNKIQYIFVVVLRGIIIKKIKPEQI